MPAPLDSPLPYQVRADLFTHLAAMEKAGLPTDKAYALLRLPGGAQQRLTMARKLLARGSDPASAGAQSGLFTVLETCLLRAALAAGSPAPTYKRLAQQYSQKALQLKQIKSRMAMPVLILCAALFVQPLPRLIIGSLSGGAYLWQALRPLLALALLGALALRVPAWYLSGMTGRPTPARSSLDGLLLALPRFGPMHARRNARDFIESLAMLLEAGVPMFDALPNALATMNNSVMRADFARILPAMVRGATLAQAVANLGCIDTDRLGAFALTGEASGSLPEMLFRYVSEESATIELFQQQLAEWLPRIFYALVAGWMISQLLVGSGPPVPPELGI